MSRISCPNCGAWRSVEQVFMPEGWDNPACGTCGDPGWIQPHDEDDPLAGRGERPRAWIDRQGATCLCTPPEPTVERFHDQWVCSCGHLYGAVQHDDESGRWYSWKRFRKLSDPDVQESLAKRRAQAPAAAENERGLTS